MLFVPWLTLTTSRTRATPLWRAESPAGTVRPKRSCTGGSRPGFASTALRHLRDPAAADDLAQDVVLMTFESLRSGRVREREHLPGGSVACTVTPEDDLLLTRLEADFNGVSRLDVVSNWEGGPEQRLEDVPVSPDARELIMAQAMPALRALGHTVLRVRLVAQEERGERLLGEYTLAHSPTRG